MEFSDTIWRRPRVAGTNSDSRTISKEDLIGFVQDRANVVLGYLGMEPMFEKERGEVSGWPR